MDSLTPLSLPAGCLVSVQTLTSDMKVLCMAELFRDAVDGENALQFLLHVKKYKICGKTCGLCSAGHRLGISNLQVHAIFLVKSFWAFSIIRLVTVYYC